ncbi:MAG TPA: winged helix-turn-helix domain-containing protein [Solirubrobacterales bacterium]|nr:winged helix-turn-helix domain-containing protein [Solirubrobacterales bacterium]
MTAKDRQTEVSLNEQFSLVISHEITVKAMILLSDGVKSPKEIGERLDISTSTASHHIKKLERLGLAELVEEREVGGAIQHFYRAIIRPIVSDEDWDKLSIEERQLYSIWIVQLILADAAKSFDAELFDAYSNRHLSRSPLLVDKEGLGEVAEIQNRALHDSFQAVAKSTERRLKSGEEGINVVSAMMCFPLPEPSEGPSLREDI